MEISGASSTKKINKRDQVSLDMKKLEKSVKADLKKSYAFSKTCCIYRVPELLRHLDEKSYTPQVVSIGPFHHGADKLEAMEDHKRMYLQEFVELTKVSVKVLLKIVEKNEARLRDCNAETINLSCEDFIKMILMDAIFIIMVTLKFNSRRLRVRCGNDRIFNSPWKVHEVMTDICLLENQLPFFILEETCKESNVVKLCKKFKIVNMDHNENVMIMVIHLCLKARWCSWVTEDSLKKVNSSELEHFVHFLEICQQPTKSQRRNKSEASYIAPRTATQLQEAGVRFEVLRDSCLLDINFSKGTLEIPEIEVQDGTEILLRNLQAYEQCHCHNKYINDYICFMGYLLNTPSDVDILVEKQIMKRVLSNNKKVVDLLHNLCRQSIVSGPFYGLRRDLNAYSRIRRHQWMANLMNVYFKNPWTTTSVIAGAILLILTAIQTVCSIVQVRQR